MSLLTGRDVIEFRKQENMFLSIVSDCQRLLFPAVEVATHMAAQILAGDAEYNTGGMSN